MFKDILLSALERIDQDMDKNILQDCILDTIDRNIKEYEKNVKHTCNYLISRNLVINLKELKK